MADKTDTRTYEQLQSEVKALHQQLDEWKAQAARAAALALDLQRALGEREAQRDALREVLESIEFIEYDGDVFCPWCSELHSHTPECKLTATLSKAKAR